MLDRLGDQLDIPLRDRNQILISAGYAPAYRQSDIDAAEMSPYATRWISCRPGTSRIRRWWWNGPGMC
jgi:hypothetical protein